MATNKKIAYLDRDGVINKKAGEHEYITRGKDLIFNDGIFELMEYLKNYGYEFIILTNQRGIARKMLTETDLAAIHGKMEKGLREHGLEILRIYVCPHDENSCDCRKPKPGLILMSARDYPINLAESILISDSADDVIMGRKAGLKYSFLVPVDQPNILLDELKQNNKYLL